MSTNRDLLKEAIADATKVKETALANAKAALEEQFVPFLKEKFSTKIAEMENEENEKITDEVEISETNEIAEEKISLEELLAELETETLDEAKKDDSEKEEKSEADEDDEVLVADMTEEDLIAAIEDVLKQMLQSSEIEIKQDQEVEGSENEGEEEDEEIDIEDIEDENSEEEIDEEIDLQELMSEADESDEDEEISENVGIDEFLAELQEAKQNNNFHLVNQELQEAKQKINSLTKELNDINVFNAKLLYTNKIFREKSLNEKQKEQVINTFNKATSKKEAELIYETLKHSLTTTIAKTPIKESLGSASKMIGNSNSQTPIIEPDAQFARWQKLAGINKSK